MPPPPLTSPPRERQNRPGAVARTPPAPARHQRAGGGVNETPPPPPQPTAPAGRLADQPVPAGADGPRLLTPFYFGGEFVPGNGKNRPWPPPLSGSPLAAVQETTGRRCAVSRSGCKTRAGAGRTAPLPS